jgi:hypothetical protein
VSGEKENLRELVEQRRQAEDEAASLRSTGRNLRNVQKAYSTERGGTWHSYS